MDLFDIIDNYDRDRMIWTPKDPPSLDGIHEITLDTETTGLKWWDPKIRDKPCGIAVKTVKGEQYIPFGHYGGNLDEAVVKRWAQRELRGKRITYANAKFDIHMMREWGVDLEEQGNEASDVMHYAALLDDHRRTFNLNQLALDYLGEGKEELDGSEGMAKYHAKEVDTYACKDVNLTERLKDKMWPLLEEQDLHRVRALEDKVIYPVCEMEKNAAPIDIELLQQFIAESDDQYWNLLKEVEEKSGFQLEKPRSADELEDLLHSLGVEVKDTTDTGMMSTSDEDLEKYDHPVINTVRRIRKISSLRSKYLIPYHRDMVDGCIRYDLHQLRGETKKGDTKGTVSGRFSSANKNIQQVMNVANQVMRLGDDQFLVRKLFVPREGLWLSADAAQIELRLFAHFAEPPEVIAAYKENPNVSYHKIIWNIVKEIVPDIEYKPLKNLNFAKLYGAGIRKLAYMMGVSVKDARRFITAYEDRFPEANKLLQQASDVADSRGYVMTLLGRRARFPKTGWLRRKLHSALNRVIQGSAGDIMKQKLVELHDERKSTGFVMRITVHDEVDGDIQDKEAANMVQRILNRQSFELNVPILWDVKTGANWGEC